MLLIMMTKGDYNYKSVVLQACYLSIVKEQCFLVCPDIRECAYLLQHLEYADMLLIMMTKVDYNYKSVILQACYLSIVKEQCFLVCPDIRECAYLLQHLDYADMLLIMMTKVDYNYKSVILQACYLSIVKEQCFLCCPDIRECAYLLQHLEYADMLLIMMTKVDYNYKSVVLQACYLSIVKEQCFLGCPDIRECAYLLQHLEYADMLLIMMTKWDYNYKSVVLQACYLSIVKEQCFLGCPDIRECAYLLQHLEYADMLLIMMTKVRLYYIPHVTDQTSLAFQSEAPININ